MRRSSLSLIILFLFSTGWSLGVYAQDSLVLQPGPNDGKDARVWSHQPNSPIPNSNKFDGMEWTFNGTPGESRGLIEFDMAPIPSTANVTSAELTLYGIDHEPRNYSNHAYLKRMTQPWKEDSVTWNTRPATDTTGQIYLPQSDSATQDYTLEVTDHVQEWVSHPDTNFGMMLDLIEEDHYTKLRFYSSDESDAALRPRLVVHYQTPDLEVNTEVEHVSDSGNADGKVTLNVFGGAPPYSYDWTTGDSTSVISDVPVGAHHVTVTDAQGDSLQRTVLVGSRSDAVTVSIKPGSRYGKDARIRSHKPNKSVGTGSSFDALEWTFGGTPGEFRSLIEFDLASLRSSNAYVGNAELHLTGYDHHPRSHTNEAYLRGLESSWKEHEVTWNSQPPQDSSEAVYVRRSRSANEDYALDLTEQALGWALYPEQNHGMVLDLVEDSPYTKLRYYSSDASTSSDRPELRVTFSLPLSVTADVEPASFDSTPDGSIDLDVTGGAPPYDYHWVGRSNSDDVNSQIGELSAGVYQVKVTDSIGQEAHRAVAVASEYEKVTLQYSPSGPYGKDATVNSGAPYENFGADPTMRVGMSVNGGDTTESRALVSTKVLGLDSSRAIIRDATLVLEGSDHDLSGSSAHLKRVLGPWSENTVNWDRLPPSDTIHQVPLPVPDSSDQDYELDITDHMQHMVYRPSQNNGFVLETGTQLELGELELRASEEDILEGEPEVIVDVDLGVAPGGDTSYAELARELDGGYYRVLDSTLRFRYFEQYAITDDSLDLRIYNGDRTPISSINYSGEVVDHGDNRYQLDVGQLDLGYYILEVTNEKGEERMLRFKVAEEEEEDGCDHVFPWFCDDYVEEYQDVQPAPIGN